MKTHEYSFEEQAQRLEAKGHTRKSGNFFRIKDSYSVGDLINMDIYDAHENTLYCRIEKTLICSMHNKWDIYIANTGVGLSSYLEDVKFSDIFYPVDRFGREIIPFQWREW